MPAISSDNFHSRIQHALPSMHSAAGPSFTGTLEVRTSIAPSGAWVTRYVVLAPPSTTFSYSRLFAFASAEASISGELLTEIFTLAPATVVVSFDVCASTCYIRIFSWTDGRTWLLRTRDRSLAESLYYTHLTRILPVDSTYRPMESYRRSSSAHHLTASAAEEGTRRSPSYTPMHLSDDINNLMETYVTPDYLQPPTYLSERRDSAFNSSSCGSANGSQRGRSFDRLAFDEQQQGQQQGQQQQRVTVTVEHSNNAGRGRSVSPAPFRDGPSTQRSIYYAKRSASLATIHKQEAIASVPTERLPVRPVKAPVSENANIFAQANTTGPSSSRGRSWFRFGNSKSKSKKALY